MFLMPTLLSDTNLFLWVDLEEPTPQEAKYVLEEVFHFHPLSIEDCVAVSPSPKVDEYVPKEEDRFAPYLFMVIHAVDYSRKDGVFATRELDFFLGRNFLVTYHTGPVRSVTVAEECALKATTNLARAPDRVAHLLLDSIVENYKPALDELSLEIAELEQEALQHPTTQTLNKILQIKKEVLHLRRIIGPQREVLARFARGEFKLIRAHLVPYYRDVYDTLSHISELAQTYADALTGILQVYLNMSSNRTGEVVKVLTLITVITTPLMMVGTWYGMNFKHMPELDWRYGYSTAVGLHIRVHAGHVLVFQEEEVVLKLNASTRQLNTSVRAPRPLAKGALCCVFRASDPRTLMPPASPASSTRSSAASGGSTPKGSRPSCSAWRANATSWKPFSTPSRTACWSWMKTGASFISTRRSRAPRLAARRRRATHYAISSPTSSGRRSPLDAPAAAWCAARVRGALSPPALPAALRRPAGRRGQRQRRRRAHSARRDRGAAEDDRGHRKRADSGADAAGGERRPRDREPHQRASHSLAAHGTRVEKVQKRSQPPVTKRDQAPSAGTCGGSGRSRFGAQT